MEEIISKEEFDKLMAIKGEARGDALKGEPEFILKEKGEEGLKKLEEAMAKLGYPIKYKEINRTNFYPLGLEAVTLVLIKKIFNFDDKKFEEMGKFESKMSFIIKIFMKYFFSIERVAKEVSNMWRKNYTVGELKVAELDENKKYAILRMENFRLHPIHCITLIGYFASVLQMMVSSKVTCQETKCIFRGDPYHEYLLKW